MPHLLLCSIVMQNIQIFNTVPVMFFVTCLLVVICHLLCRQLLLSRTELTKWTPDILMYNGDHTIFPSLSILFLCATAHKVSIFEKFIFKLELFLCDFKIDSILVWQLKSLNKKMVVSSGKFNISFLSVLL